MRKTATLNLGRYDSVFVHFSVPWSLKPINADGFGHSVSLIAALRAAGGHDGSSNHMRA